MSAMTQTSQTEAQQRFRRGMVLRCYVIAGFEVAAVLFMVFLGERLGESPLGMNWGMVVLIIVILIGGGYLSFWLITTQRAMQRKATEAERPY